jgi:hypothetical protein
MEPNMTPKQADANFTRRLLYFAIFLVLVAIFIGASRDVSPVYLAVGFISEIILVCTVHLSSVIQSLRADFWGGESQSRTLGARRDFSRHA